MILFIYVVLIIYIVINIIDALSIQEDFFVDNEIDINDIVFTKYIKIKKENT